MRVGAGPVDLLALMLVLGTSPSRQATATEGEFPAGLADGFDFPVGDRDGKGPYKSFVDGRTFPGWVVATRFAEHYFLGIHTGEDWNGSGGDDTDLGQPIHAIARGTVVYAQEAHPPFGKIVVIEHRYLDNGDPFTVLSQYDHLQKIGVSKGQIVEKREVIGTIGKGAGGAYPAHLHLELRKSSLIDLPPEFWPSAEGKTEDWVRQNYESPSEFIRSHRALLDPAAEPLVLVVVKHRYRMYVLQRGALTKTYEVALSQSPLGHKERAGDNRLPEGEYRICEKTKGPFGRTPWWNAFLGPAWLGINYPNVHDAKGALARKLISRADHDAIVAAARRNGTPPKGTRLGGGIGIHGWLESDWREDGGRDLTWGCISMHNADLEAFFNTVPLGTAILIRP